MKKMLLAAVVMTSFAFAQTAAPAAAAPTKAKTEKKAPAKAAKAEKKTVKAAKAPAKAAKVEKKAAAK